MQINDKGRKIDPSTYGVISYTLTASAAAIPNMQAGKPFNIYNTGNQVAYFGPNAANCKVPIQAGAKDGVFVSPDGNFYAYGTAGQTVLIVFLNEVA